MILIIIGILIVAGIVIYLVLMKYLNRQYLLKSGIPTNAKVVTVTKTIAEVYDSTSLPKPIMEIDFGVSEKGEPYRLVTIRRAYDISERIPVEGENVLILIDPKNPDNAMISPNQNRDR